MSKRGEGVWGLGERSDFVMYNLTDELPETPSQPLLRSSAIALVRPPTLFTQPSPWTRTRSSSALSLVPRMLLTLLHSLQRSALRSRLVIQVGILYQQRKHIRLRILDLLFLRLIIHSIECTAAQPIHSGCKSLRHRVNVAPTSPQIRENMARVPLGEREGHVVGVTLVAKLDWLTTVKIRSMHSVAV